MPIQSIHPDILKQALANVRLESLDISQQLKDMLENEKTLTTSEILRKIIEA